MLPAGAAIYALETAEGFDWDDLDASVGVGLTLSLDAYPVDPSIVETHDKVATLAAAGVRRALVDADWTVPEELARAPLYGGLLVAYRGVVGMPWQTLSPPAAGRAGAWRAEVAAWRRELRNRFDLARAPAYGDARQAWASARNWVAPQAMLHDRFLYDRASGAWTPDRFLDALVWCARAAVHGFGRAFCQKDAAHRAQPGLDDAVRRSRTIGGPSL